MDTREALQALGVHERVLSDTQIQQFDALGYVIVPDVFSPEQVQAMCAELARLHAIEGDYGGHEVHIEPGAMRLSNLFNKSPVFMQCLRCAPTLYLAHRLLGELHVYSLNARNPAKGSGRQPLHSDTPRAYDGDYRMVNTMVLLDDMTEDNGPTRVVPGSHRWAPINVPDINMNEVQECLYTPEEAAMVPQDPLAPHPQEVHITGHAGSVAVINGRIWHGGTENRSGASRRVLHLAIGRRDCPQQLNERAHLTRALLERSNAAERFLLDIEGAQPVVEDPLMIPDDARIWKSAATHVATQRY